MRLADGTWLLAPTGAALRRLLDGARAPDLLPRRMAITTPAHLEALVLRRAGASLARRASLALPVLEPALSAHGAVNARSMGAALGIAVAAAALSLLMPTMLAVFVGALFLAAMGFRWLVSAAGLSDRPDDEPPRQADADLPRYTVLVPLCAEATMVPVLIRRLRALDYPAAKLEILMLVESDDILTRAALAAAPRPPWMRVDRRAAGRAAHQAPCPQPGPGIGSGRVDHRVRRRGQAASRPAADGGITLRHRFATARLPAGPARDRPRPTLAAARYYGAAATSGGDPLGPSPYRKVGWQ